MSDDKEPEKKGLIPMDGLQLAKYIVVVIVGLIVGIMSVHNQHGEKISELSVLVREINGNLVRLERAVTKLEAKQ